MVRDVEVSCSTVLDLEVPVSATTSGREVQSRLLGSASRKVKYELDVLGWGDSSDVLPATQIATTKTAASLPLQGTVAAVSDHFGDLTLPSTAGDLSALSTKLRTDESSLQEWRQLAADMDEDWEEAQIECYEEECLRTSHIIVHHMRDLPMEDQFGHVWVPTGQQGTYIDTALQMQNAAGPQLDRIALRNRLESAKDKRDKREHPLTNLLAKTVAELRESPLHDRCWSEGTEEHRAALFVLAAYDDFAKTLFKKPGE